ncbi:polysaccharide deacetylase family protein [Brevibacillus brevis]|uniref:polysaccharide deacetylase family protein n=1 Tax=Brevibacillus brevis TaxID=1393 RepID=UPI0025A68E04|nr:polysaccharide deacetylase family protein [Brevibacillus brevis]WJQ80983.1 polysaccharide deacetylase family protein [Brevibacillus brevis]
MANHTMNHATLKDLKDTAAIEKEIGDAEDWLNANGFTKASNILAYPYGAYDARVLQVMQSRRAGRTVQDDTATTPPPDKRTIKIRNVDHTITPTTLKEHIDAAVNVGGVCLFMFHKLVRGTATSGIEYNVSNFQEVVDYAFSGELISIP